MQVKNRCWDQELGYSSTEVNFTSSQDELNTEAVLNTTTCLDPREVPHVEQKAVNAVSTRNAKMFLPLGKQMSYYEA